MLTQGFKAALLRGAARIGRDSTGQVSLTFALSIFPLMAMLGAAVDYTHAVMQRSELQSAADAAALAVSQNAQTATPAQLQTQAQQYLSGVTTDSQAQVTSTTISADRTQLCVYAQSSVPTSFMQMVGVTNLPVRASTCTTMGGSMYEVSLVLDTSGSMLESTSGTTKIASLQTAATQFVSLLNPDPLNPHASISIVPFSAAVNVGTSNANASFMDTSAKSSIHWQNYQRPAGAPWLPTSRFDIFSKMNATWAGCVEERPDPYMTTDTPSNAATPDTLFVPYLAPDEAGDSSGYTSYGYGGTYTSRGKTYYNKTGTSYNSYLDDSGGSCTTSPTDPYTVADGTDPISQGSGATKLCKYKGQSPSGSLSAFGTGNTAGPNLLCDASPLLTMTNSSTTLLTKIAALSAKGSTNLLSGFMWGWRTISPNGPFNTQGAVAIGAQNAKAYGAKNNQKVIVLMTDGYNSWTGNSNSPYGSTYLAFGYYANNRLSAHGTNQGNTTSSNVRAQMDGALLDACTNAKAAGVQIYTVGFSIPSDPIDTQGLNLLQSCASQNSMAYIAQDGTSFVAAFKNIAQGIGQLRISH